jgi:hypothetical protein
VAEGADAGSASVESATIAPASRLREARKSGARGGSFRVVGRSSRRAGRPLSGPLNRPPGSYKKYTYKDTDENGSRPICLISLDIFRPPSVKFSHKGKKGAPTHQRGNGAFHGAPKEKARSKSDRASVLCNNLEIRQQAAIQFQRVSLMRACR